MGLRLNGGGRGVKHWELLYPRQRGKDSLGKQEVQGRGAPRILLRRRPGYWPSYPKPEGQSDALCLVIMSLVFGPATPPSCQREWGSAVRSPSWSGGKEGDPLIPLQRVTTFDWLGVQSGEPPACVALGQGATHCPSPCWPVMGLLPARARKRAVSRGHCRAGGGREGGGRANPPPAVATR